MAGATSSLILSPWQATLDHYNNKTKRFFVKGYPFPCHHSDPICHSFNIKRRVLSASSASIFKDNHVVTHSSSSSDKLQTHFSMSGNNNMLPPLFTFVFESCIVQSM